MIYPISTYIFKWHILTKLLASYIQYKYIFLKMYIHQTCARRAHRNPPTYIHPLLESCVYCLFIGPGSRSRRRSEQVRPYGLYIFIIPFLWTRPKYITKGILSSCSSLQLLMDLLIAGKILLFFSQRLMDLLKLIMCIALTHSTAFLTSPHCKKLKEQILCSNYNLI